LLSFVLIRALDLRYMEKSLDLLMTTLWRQWLKIQGGTQEYESSS